MPSSSQNDVPIDKVVNLKQQGQSDAQIIQSLQREGYRVDQIYDALNQADIKGGVESGGPPS